MKRFEVLWNSVVRFLNSLEWISLLLVRLALGLVFVESGWGKLHNLPKVIEFFASLGIPAPQLQAPFVSALELICGALVLVVLFTRLAAVPLIPMMAVATITAKLGDVQEFTDLFGLIEVLYLILAVVLITRGAGCVSADHLLFKMKKKSGAA